MGERRGTKGLELWCKKMTEGYPGVKIDNMTTSWRDGLAFCAIIHHFRPELIDFSKLNKDDVYRNNELAFRVAEQYLGIPALLEAEDMVEYPVPDRLSILTYLSQFYQAFAISQGSPSRIVPKRPATVPDRGIVSPASTSPPTKMAIRSGPVGMPRREPCAKCNLPVFIAERLNVGRQLYHRTCFRCARCNSQLTLANYYETETENQFCCEMCPDEDSPVKPNDASPPINRSLSDEEKSSALKDDYSAMFETALEYPQSEASSSEFTRARSRFMSALVTSSDEEGEPPDLPQSRPPFESYDSGLPQSADVSSVNNSAKVVSDGGRPGTAGHEQTDVTKEHSNTSLVQARMRLFQGNTVPSKLSGSSRDLVQQVDAENVNNSETDSKKFKISVNKFEEMRRADEQDALDHSLSKSKDSLDKSQIGYSCVDSSVKYKDSSIEQESVHKEESLNKFKDCLTTFEDSVDKPQVSIRTSINKSEDSVNKYEDVTKIPVASVRKLRGTANREDSINKSEEHENKHESNNIDLCNEEPKPMVNVIIEENSVVSKIQESVDRSEQEFISKSKPDSNNPDVSSYECPNLDESMDSAIIEENNLRSKVKNVITEDRNVIPRDKNVIVEDKNVIIEDKNVITEDKNIISEGKNVIAEDKDVITEDKNVIAEETSEEISVITEEKNVITEEKSVIIEEKESKPEETPSLLDNKLEDPEYPEDLNPFEDEEYNKDLNPFDDDDDVAQTATPKIVLHPNLRDATLKGSQGDTPEFLSRVKVSRISIGPFEKVEKLKDSTLVQEFKKPEPVPRKLPAPRISLNPFWSDDEDNEAGNNKKVAGDMPEPKPRAGISASFSSTTSLSSTASSAASTRKKGPAPRPPVPGEFMGISPQHSQASSPSSSVHHSPKPRKSRRAPLPPTSTPFATREVETFLSPNVGPISLNISDAKTEKMLEATQTVLSPSLSAESGEFEKEKVVKDEVNRNRQSQSFGDKSYRLSAPNKSMYGKWKRKKGQAPTRPIPQKRTIKALPMVEVKRELDIIEVQQQGLEKQGVRLEQIIRERCEGPNSDPDSAVTIEAEDLILQLFEVVNEKNELCRRQAELMYLQRQHRLEEEHAEVEYQIRCLMLQPEANKTDTDKAKEEELINRLVDIVERRNEIIECLEMDRLREAEEDDSICTSMNSYAAKREESASPDVKETKKKKKRFKKFKLKHSHKVDMDKDVDESESSTASKETLSKEKKKKFKLF